MEPEKRGRRRLPVVTNEKGALPSDRSSEYSSSTLVLQGPPTSRCTDLTHSSDSWSSEIMDITNESGSDCTDFTPGEFSDYPRLTSLSSTSRPPSGSSDTLHAGGGPYVARINVTAPTNHNSSSSSPIRDRTNSHRSGRLMPKPAQDNDAPLRIINNCETAFKHRKTTKKDPSPTSPADDRNRTVNLLDPLNASAHRKSYYKEPFRHPETRENDCSSTSTVRSNINHDGTVNMIVPLVQESDSSVKRKKCGSPSKHPPTTSDRNCYFVSLAGDRDHRVNQQAMELQIAEYDITGSQNNDREVSSNHPRKTKNDNSLILPAGDHNNHQRTVHSTAADWKASARRKNKRSKHLPRMMDGCSSNSSADSPRTNSRSTVVEDTAVVEYCGPVRRKHDEEIVSTNDGGHRRKLSRKRGGVTRRRGSTGDDPVTSVSAFRRCNGPDVENTAECSEDVIMRSTAADNVELPSQAFRLTDQKAASVNRHGNETTRSRTSERSVEEDKCHKAKLAQMKQYCLEQLAAPSKSMLEVARRRGKQQRKIATETPGSVHALKSVASAAPREYASRHQYPLPSTMNRDCSPPFNTDANDANGKSPEISVIGKTKPQQRSSSSVRDDKIALQTLDRYKDRIVSENSERKREVLVRKSPEEDTMSHVTVRTDCSSTSGRVNTLSRAGRLSVTITDNEPEPEIQRTIKVGRMTLPSLEAEHLKISRREDEKTYCGQLNVVLADNYVTNRNCLQNHETSPSGNSFEYYNSRKSSSSEGTVNGVSEDESEEETTNRMKENFRHPSKGTFIVSSAGQQCVDVAVQVEVEELQRRDREPAKCQPTSDSVIKSSRIQSLSAASERTSTGKSSESESSSSKEYFRRSGRSSMVLPRSRHKGSTGIQSEKNTAISERSAKNYSRMHRHSVAAIDSERQEHLGGTRLHDNYYETSKEAVPSETYRTPDTNLQDGVEKSRVEGRHLKTTAKGEEAKVEELQCRSTHPASRLSASQSDCVVNDGRVQTLSADSAAGKSPDSESSSPKEYFRRSGIDVWRASMVLFRSSGKGSYHTQSENNRTNGERSTAKKPSRRRHRHSVAALGSEHQEHLRSTNPHNSLHPKTVEVVSIENFRTSDINWQSETGRYQEKEEYVKTTAEAEDNPAEFRRGTCNLLQNGDVEADRRCQNNLEVQASTSTAQMQSKPSAASLNSSLIDVVVYDGCQNEERGTATNRIPIAGATETPDKQAEYETTGNNRTRGIQQQRLDEIRDRETSTIMTKITKDDNEPPGTGNHVYIPEFPQNRNPETNSDTIQSSLLHHSLSSPLDASLVDVVVEDGYLAKERKETTTKGATREVLETAGQWNTAEKAGSSDHHRCDNLRQTDPQRKKSEDNFSFKSGRNVVPETFRGETSLTNTLEENIEQSSPDMTSTNNRPYYGLPSSTRNSLHQVSSPPVIASFFTRIFNRWK